MILVDTNVVSEFMRELPDASVLAWAERLGADDLTISVVTVQEIEHGIARLPFGQRRTALDQKWGRVLLAYGETVAVYDVAAARATAQSLTVSEAAGRAMSLADAQIAGMCLAKGWTLATRNIDDFAGISDLHIVNPFAAP